MKEEVGWALLRIQAWFGDESTMRWNHFVSAHCSLNTRSSSSTKCNANAMLALGVMCFPMQRIFNPVQRIALYVQ